MFAITGVTQWVFDEAPNIWVPSVVALGTAGVLVGGVAALRSRWSASFTAAGDRWAVVLAVLIGANPLVYIVATGISYPAIGVMLVVVAIAALVPNGRAAALLIAALNAAWIFLVIVYPPDVSTVTAALQIAKADAVALVVALTWSRTRARLNQANETVRRLAMVDELTGLANRRALTEHGQRVLARAQAHGTAFGVIFIDVDDLKTVNDTLGHAAGDDRIKEVADSILRTCGHGTTFTARISGDEFAVVLQPSTSSALHSLTTRIRTEIEAGSIGVSIGSTQWSTSDGNDFQAVLDCADRKMYADKRIRRTRRT
jgi:diguanylate cyclase (GGDEF)-like protein